MNKNYNELLKIKHNIDDTFHVLNLNGQNLYQKYYNWLKSENNTFDSLLQIANPFDLNNVGEVQFFGKENKEDMLQLDFIKMSVFYSEELYSYTQDIFNKVISSQNNYDKESLLREYFSTIKMLVQKKELSILLIFLFDFAEQQDVLCGKRKIDLYKVFIQLKDILSFKTIESFYLLFSFWRLTSDNDLLITLVNNIVSFLREFYYAYESDQDMHLFHDISQFNLLDKLNCISHWFSCISYNTSEIMKKYDTLNWLIPKDELIDNYILTPQISKFEMLKYKIFFKNDNDQQVKNKAICNQSYGMWIRTADILYITAEISKLIYRSDNIEKNKALEIYDNYIKIRDCYIGKVFKHRAYYEENKKYLDSSISEIIENDSKTINKLSNTFLNLSNSILDNDLDKLLDSKKNCLMLLKGKLTDEQLEYFDQYMANVIELIKNKAKKENEYSSIYKHVSSEFSKYSSELIIYQDIFDSLVSAEYLYSQYVNNADPIKNFDYSCISIMYYVALEEFLNKIIYSPYYDSVLINHKKDEWNLLVSNPNKFWDNKNKSYKKHCEIGNMGFLLKSITKENLFMKYIINKFPNSTIENIISYGGKLKSISNRRNNAAHGAHVLSYNTVREDKELVFYIESISENRGLILELLSILYD